ncbi:unnamed protein product [Parajaminaea phylloscopi]
MSKQSTLGKFVQYPPGAARPPAQQSDLRSMFKRNKSGGVENHSVEDDVDASSGTSSKVKVEDTEGVRRSPSPETKPKVSKKRGRIVESDESASEDASPPKAAIKRETSSPAPSPKRNKASGKVGTKQPKAEVAEMKHPKEEERRSTSPSPAASVVEDEKEDRKSHIQVASMFQKGNTGKEKAPSGWTKGKPVPYAALAHTFSQIDATTKRLEIQSILSSFLTDVIAHAQDPQEVIQVVYLCINRLCPDYIGLELGLGEGLIVKALAQAFGREIPKIKKELEEKGDLGLVAISSRAKQPTMFKTTALTVPSVFSTLKDIATLSGNKSQERKLGLIKKLLSACQGDETKWIVRSLEGKLRIGLAERTVLVGLAHSAVLHHLGKKKDKLSAEELSSALERGNALVKAAYSEMPNYDRLIPVLIAEGPEALPKHCHLTPGIPLKPMLAKPTKAITEVLDRFEGKLFTCEYKYDGERAQVHFYVPGEAEAVTGEQAAPTRDVAAPGTGASGKAGHGKGKLGVFSRNSEDMSVKYPDLLESIPKFVKSTTKSFVLDAEVTAWKKAVVGEGGEVRDAGGLQPFQQLSTRKRKDIQLDQITVKVKLFAFDLLYLNGESLLHEDLATRRAKLREAFQPVQDEFDFATSQDCNTVEEIQTFLDASVADRCEGLMVKMLEGSDAFYEPSRRSMNWLKLKKDYLSGTGDSLDLVVIGGYYGKGKRTNVYGAFLLGCWDYESESYQSVCKIGTGFSEANLEEFTQVLKPLELTTKKGYYDMGDAKPDVFFEPKVVWEVLTADLSLSPVYTAAKGVVEKRGISLRFPRFIRIRDDKEPEDSTTPEQIADMYRAQASAAKGGGAAGAEDDYW